MKDSSDKTKTTDTTSTGSSILRGPHSYEVYTPLCIKGGDCTREKVFETMTSQKSYVTPTLQTEPVTDGSKTKITGLGTVEHSVDPSSFTVTNTTQSDHVLHPGTVQRQIVEQGGEVGVRTTGTGEGVLPRVNTALAPLVWTPPDLALRSAVNSKTTDTGSTSGTDVIDPFAD